jgi:rod shape-determining protein MreD
MRMVFALILFVVVSLLLRSTALTALAARGLIFDVLAFATVVWALRYDAAWGATFGFAVGLAADLDAAHWMGRHALLLSLLGYAIGRLNRTVVPESARTQAVLLFAATFLHQIWVVSFELGGVSAWPHLAQRVGLATLVTTPLGTLLLMLVKHVTGQPLFRHAATESRATP